MVALPLILGEPLNYPNFYFFVACNIFVVGECRDFKFCVQVDDGKSQPTDDKLSLKGTWSHHVTHFKFLVSLKYFWMA